MPAIAEKRSRPGTHNNDNCHPRLTRALQELRTCFFLQIMPHVPERIQMDMGGASENVASAVHNAPHHFCSQVYDALEREM